MAKSQRSKVKKALRTQAREKALQTPWLVAAEKKRYAATQDALAAEALPAPPREEEPEEMAVEKQPRGRAGKKAGDGMAVDTKQRKGISVKGVQKRKQKKVSVLWTVFDKSGPGKKSKKGGRKGR